MQSQDNKNLLLAIALSVIVMVGWNYYFGMPKLDQQRQQAQQTQTATQTPGTLTQGGTNVAPASAAVPATQVLPREEALKLSPRIAIETASLTGSIALIGGRIDDLHLVKYRETVDPKSSTIVLFAPANAKDGYYADFGWVGTVGQNVALPGPETRWQASGDKLTPKTPVTLTFDNGQALSSRG